jgi:hypothetical protein
VSDTDPVPFIRADVAGRLGKGIPLVGGTLVLTPDELLFFPLIDRDALARSSRAAKLSKQLHDWPAHPQTFINAAVKPLAKQVRIRLRDIDSVEPTRRCAIRISWLDGSKRRTTEYGISAKRFSPVWSPENVPVRDALLVAIEDARRSDPRDLPG